MEKEIISPVVFGYEICPNCNGITTLSLVDQYGHHTSTPIYTATCLRCDKCGKEFPIQWKPITEDDTKPFPSTEKKKQEFSEEFIRYALEHVRKLD